MGKPLYLFTVPHKYVQYKDNSGKIMDIFQKFRRKCLKNTQIEEIPNTYVKT